MAIWNEIKSLKIGTKIPKVRDGKVSTLLQFTESDGEDALYYSIGDAGNSKCVLKSEFESSFDILQSTGKLTREWYNAKFPKFASSRPCNFTTIGGILVLLSYAEYTSKGVYIRK